jgi:hypothetical protein
MTFRDFCDQVETLLDGTASGKGYNANGPDSRNALYEFVQEMTGGPHHACGEVVYKVKRYEAKRNPEDILKAAAWCFLILKHESAVLRPDATERNAIDLSLVRK